MRTSNKKLAIILATLVMAACHSGTSANQPSNNSLANAEYVIKETPEWKATNPKLFDFTLDNESKTTITKFIGYNESQFNIVIPKFINGNPVVTIGSGNVDSFTLNANEQVFKDFNIQSVAIPNSIKTIGSWAFLNNTSLQSVKFEEGSKLKAIGFGAFQGTGINSITIPNSVETIGLQSFHSNKSLQSIKFQDNSRLKTIHNRAFANISIESITIPASVEIIGDYVFEIDQMLRNVKFEDNSKLKTILSCAFLETGLTSITIPNGVETIGNEAFRDTKLETVVLTQTLYNQLTKDDRLQKIFTNKDGNVKIKFSCYTEDQNKTTPCENASTNTN